MWDLEFPQIRVHSVPLEFPEAGIQEAAGNLLPSSGERSGLWWESACHQHRDGVQSHGQDCSGQDGGRVPGNTTSQIPPFPQGPSRC